MAESPPRSSRAASPAASRSTRISTSRSQLVFRPHPPEARPDEEVELSESELDIVFYEGSSIDIGEAVAETMALSLDPYPRAPERGRSAESGGVKSEEEAGPFGALAGLRDKLKR